MNSSFSQMKSYCSFSIRLNGLKKYIRDHQILVVYFFQNFHFNWFFFLSSLRSLSSLVSLLSVLSLSLRFLLKHGTAWASVCGWKRRRCGGWLGLRSQHETGLGFGLRLETPAWWWWLGLAISAWWWLGLADLGVVVAWACRSCESRPGHGPPRRGSLLRSVTTEATPWSTDHLAVPIPTVWRWWSLPIFTVVFGCSDFRWFLVRTPRQLVIFGAKQQLWKVKNIIFKCGKIIKKYI